jgi:hypothetical protein
MKPVVKNAPTSTQLLKRWETETSLTNVLGAAGYQTAYSPPAQALKSSLLTHRKDGLSVQEGKRLVPTSEGVESTLEISAGLRTSKKSIKPKKVDLVASEFTRHWQRELE